MIPVMSRTAILFFDWLFSKVTSSRCSRAWRPDFALTVTPWTKCRKLLRTLKPSRMPSTIAIFIQAFPRRGGCGGGGGVISGGGFAGMIGGGGAWPDPVNTSFSIVAANYLMGLARASAIQHSAKLHGESTTSWPELMVSLFSPQKERAGERR